MDQAEEIVAMIKNDYFTEVNGVYVFDSEPYQEACWGVMKFTELENKVRDILEKG